MSTRAGCVEHIGHATRCGLIATGLVTAEANLCKVAKVGARSREQYDKVRGAIAAAKAERTKWRLARDAHMAECPHAAERFDL